MTFTGDIRNRRDPSGKLDTGDLTNGRVGFLGLDGVHLVAYCLFLETLFEQRRFG